MNNFTFIGRLVRDPELHTTGSDTLIARYTLAVQRDKDTADFFNIVAFNKTAEFAEKFLRQGTKVAITGRVQNDNYTDKDGNKHYTCNFIANSHEFCESKSATNEFVHVDDIEEDLPFKEEEKPQPQRNTRTTTRKTRTRTR